MPFLVGLKYTASKVPRHETHGGMKPTPAWYYSQRYQALIWWVFWTTLQTLVIHRMGFNWAQSVIDAAITHTIFFGSGFILANTYRYYRPGTVHYSTRIGYVIALTLLSVAAQRIGLELIWRNDEKYRAFLSFSMPVRFLFSLAMTALIAALHWLTYALREQEKFNTRKKETEALWKEAELSRLRQQLQPHFLFNSLNSISALAGSKPEEARKMIHNLSDFLRSTLKKDDHQLVPLSEELRNIALYLSIERVRFGDRLHVEIEHDTSCDHLMLPGLLLQPIIENAIKFGLYDTTEQVTITLHSSCAEGMLQLKVCNPYDEETSQPPSGAGFGLSSVQRRLYLLYARHDLLTTEKKDHLFCTIVHIPQQT